jgi:uncharacterized repeat protein (TIGR03803 family)
MDAAGNLFGTTSFGGESNDGMVFEVGKGSGMVTTLASFDGSNGQQPVAGLVMDAGGNLFGTTLKGGTSDVGTIFELPAGSNTITALVSFDTANGARPMAPLVMDASGNLFGTASTGGNAKGDGTVFAFGNLSVTPGGGGGPGGGGTCGTIPGCLAALQAAEPAAASASNHKQRKVAIQLDKLVARAATLISRATMQTGKKQHRSYKRAHELIEHTIQLAKAASAKGTLGVALGPIETAGNALVGLLPA